MIHQSKSYLKFLRTSKNQHGVHSPFVYDLVTKCFYDKQLDTSYELLKQFRKHVKKNSGKKITVTDFGSGSRRFKSNHRSVKNIVKWAGIKPKRARLLNRLVRYLHAETILELGTSVGLATAALAAGNENSTITTVEGCPKTLAIAEANFDHFNFENINCVNSPFEGYLNTATQAYDMVFLDGHHNEKATLKYFNRLIGLTHNDSVIIIDDIYLNKGMTRAWETIKMHDLVRVTIDTYKWGFVFFRKEQAKEHFTIRV